MEMDTLKNRAEELAKETGMAHCVVNAQWTDVLVVIPESHVLGRNVLYTARGKEE